MAKDTDQSLQNAVMYSMFVRNHTEEGTFRAIIPDLDRIKALGTDIIWLMPIHPVGEVKRKGKDGSPYAIKDYRSTNPSYGTKEELICLVDEIHKRGMKCIIDVVYNHTSPDSVLTKEHPEYFYRKADGSMGNHIGEWSDVVDLDYNKRQLWDYQIETLKQWAEIVDGFRCDVAPMVPVAFWEKARNEVPKVKPGCIWLAESGHFSFIKELRDRNLPGATDNELYSAFDLCYDYDVHPELLRYLRGEISLSWYADSLKKQEGMYPLHAVRLRFLENHDNERIAALVKDETALLNYYAFLYFERGTTLIYEGQEFTACHRPSIFDKDPVVLGQGRDRTALFQTLCRLKKDPIRRTASYRLGVSNTQEAIVAGYFTEEGCLWGIFHLDGRPGSFRISAPDGTYSNEIDGTEVTVKNGELATNGHPVIFRSARIQVQSSENEAAVCIL